jgi:hypothetical protein
MSRATRLAWLEERPEDRRFLARCLAKRPTDEEDPEDGDADDEDPDDELPDDEDPDDARKLFCQRADNAMVKALARAFRWRGTLENGTYGTIKEIAAAEDINVLRRSNPAADFARARHCRGDC